MVKRQFRRKYFKEGRASSPPSGNFILLLIVILILKKIPPGEGSPAKAGNAWRSLAKAGNRLVLSVEFSHLSSSGNNISGLSRFVFGLFSIFLANDMN